jgi:hypothetical protein
VSKFANLKQQKLGWKNKTQAQGGTHNSSDSEDEIYDICHLSKYLKLAIMQALNITLI